MAGTRRRDAILAVTYCLLFITVGSAAARFAAWRHEGWAGFWYSPALGEKFKGKTVFFKQGAVSSVFSGGPAQAAGITVGDVILTVNGIPTSDWEQLAKFDDHLKVNDRISYQVKRRDGSQTTLQVQLGSPLRSRQIEVSILTSLAVALAFCALGTLVYWRKPDDERALVFYLLSFVSTMLFLVSPLVYVDEFPSRGARSLAQMTGHQVTLYLVGTTVVYAAQVLMVHLALIFPRKRPALQRDPKVLLWLYLAPLLQFIGFPTFAMLNLPGRWLRAMLILFWALLLAISGFLARRCRQQGWKRALGSRPVMVLSAVVLLIVAGVNTALQIVPSEATRQTIGWTFGAVAFGLISLAVFVIYSVIACVALYRSYRESGVEEKKQVRWPLWGTIVSLSGVLFLIGLSAFPELFAARRFVSLIVIEVAEKTFYIFIPLSFAFAILKYRLMDIDIVIWKTVIYSIVSGCVVALYLGLAGGLGGWLVTQVGVHSTWVTVGATLAAVAVFVPVRNRVQHVVDERFFRRQEDLPRALRTLNEKTAEITDLSVLLGAVAEHVVQVLKIRNVVIFRQSLREQSFVAAVEVGLHDRIDPARLLKGLRFARDTPLLASTALAFRPPHDLPEPERVALTQLGTALIVPVRRREEKIGFISLGRKLSDQEFEPDETEFLAAVADQTAAAIYNLHLRRQAQEYEEALEIQQALIPKQIPQASGLEMAGSWRPARIVGGDYFDVFKFSETRLGLCIADVSGKGMPAALLMSNLQAVVKALATESIAPKELVEKVNRVMWRNTTEAKFITLFNAVLDVESRSLRYTNAGHNAPILTRRDGAQLRLDHGGVILGAFQESEYEQGEVDLRPGDRLVLFTDGVSEAVNVEGEEFGEERLVEASLHDRELVAEAMHQSLLRCVTEFCSGEFDDDATVLVVAVL
jgi:sigma-B regulation protein RsbU (phosphoserine phosphatase)